MKTLTFVSLGCTIMTSTVAGQSPNYMGALSVRNEIAATYKPLVKKKIQPLVHWEHSRDVRNGHIGKQSYKEMVKQAQALAAYLQDSCLSPDGVWAAWHGEFTGEGKAPDQQFSSAVIGEFSPDAADSSANLPGPQELRLIVNDTRPLFSDSLVINNRVYSILTVSPVPRNGSLYFPPSAAGDNAGNRGTSTNSMWLILGDNMPSPYLPLTRKEYLTEAAQELLVEKTTTIQQVKQQNPIRPESIQKADKEAAISLIEQTCTGVQLQIRMRAFLAKYQSDEARQQEAIAAATSHLDTVFKLMTQLMTNLSPEELERPAFVSVRADAFQGFEDLISEYGMLVKLNPLYHGTPGSILPNLFIVSLTSNAAHQTPGTEDLGYIHFIPEKLRSLLK